MMTADLNIKQKRFCDEYLKDFNGKQSAIRAKYSKKTAEVQASRLLSNVNVQKYIAERMKKIQDKLEITQEMIMEELAIIGFSRVTDYLSVENTTVKRKVRGKMKSIIIPLVSIFPTAEMKKEKIPAIAGIKQAKEGIELKLHDKVKALELMGKHRGMFKEMPQPIELNVTIE